MIAIDLVSIIAKYNKPIGNFTQDFVGATLWKGIYCPAEPCTGTDGLHGVYLAMLLTDIALLLISICACLLLVSACWRWAAYSASARRLTAAYSAIFVAPFILLLLLPPAIFIDVPSVQRALCLERLRELLPELTPNTGGRLAQRRMSEQVCYSPIELWSEIGQALLIQNGVMVNKSTGTCTKAEERLAAGQQLFASSGKACQDDEASLAFVMSRSPIAVQDCRSAANIHLCAHAKLRVRATVQAYCPVSCGICTAQYSAGGACVDDDAFVASLSLAAGSTCGALANLGACTVDDAAKRRTMQRRCPVSCGTCPSGGSCRDDPDALALLAAAQAYTQSSCAGAFSVGLCAQTEVSAACADTCGVCTPAGRRRSMQSLSPDDLSELTSEIFRVDGGRPSRRAPKPAHAPCAPRVPRVARIRSVRCGGACAAAGLALRRGGAPLLHPPLPPSCPPRPARTPRHPSLCCTVCSPGGPSRPLASSRVSLVHMRPCRLREPDGHDGHRLPRGAA